jgi:hypothetical protein
MSRNDHANRWLITFASRFVGSFTVSAHIYLCNMLREPEKGLADTLFAHSQKMVRCTVPPHKGVPVAPPPLLLSTVAKAFCRVSVGTEKGICGRLLEKSSSPRVAIPFYVTPFLLILLKVCLGPLFDSIRQHSASRPELREYTAAAASPREDAASRTQHHGIVSIKQYQILANISDGACPQRRLLPVQALCEPLRRVSATARTAGPGPAEQRRIARGGRVERGVPKRGLSSAILRQIQPVWVAACRGDCHRRR